jgi:hypothetical protein
MSFSGSINDINTIRNHKRFCCSFTSFTQERKEKIWMYEFRIVVGMERGEEQVFIVNAEANNADDAKDQIRYLVENKLEMLSISQINMDD